jgi:hypothetical protein
LWCPKWWRGFGDLFDFLGYLPQAIVAGVCCMYAVVALGVKFPRCFVEEPFAL